MSHSDRWNETCFNDQCNVLIVSIFAIYLQKSGSPRLPNGNFETYDEDVWYKAAENLGEMMEKMRLDLIQNFNYEVRICSYRKSRNNHFCLHVLFKFVSHSKSKYHFRTRTLSKMENTLKSIFGAMKRRGGHQRMWIEAEDGL